MSDLRSQWNKVDRSLLQKLVLLHNRVSLGLTTQREFDSFILENKERFDNPDYLQVFAANVDPQSEGFFRQNFEMCKVFYEFMESNPDWKKLSFDFGTFLKLCLFEENFKDYLAKVRSISNTNVTKEDDNEFFRYTSWAYIRYAYDTAAH